jgi:hypothetical protein
MEYLWAWGTLIHEINLSSKISCQTPFTVLEPFVCQALEGWIGPVWTCFLPSCFFHIARIDSSDICLVLQILNFCWNILVWGAISPPLAYLCISGLLLQTNSRARLGLFPSLRYSLAPVRYTGIHFFSIVYSCIRTYLCSLSRMRMRELRQLVSQNSTVEEIQAIGKCVTFFIPWSPPCKCP